MPDELPFAPPRPAAASAPAVHSTADPVAPPRRILHCDMDSFYASVHIRDDPALAGKPVCIGGDPEGRGVVAAASYEARRYGIHSAMPAARARRLCPHALFLRPDFTRYRRESERIFAIYRRFTPILQTLSLDEAYLDVSDHLAPWGTARAVAVEIRRVVREEVGLTVSVGVGPNRLVAKIASDHGKPDGLTVVPPARVQVFLDPLPVRRLPGVGPATEKLLAELGIATVAELRAADTAALARRLGSYGAALQAYAHGIDERPVHVHQARKSLSSERTYARDLERLADMDAELTRLAAEVARGLERRGLAAGAVTVKIRYSDFTTVTRSRTLAVPSAAPAVLERLACDLLRRSAAGHRSVRLLGVGASSLVRGAAEQLALFEL